MVGAGLGKNRFRSVSSSPVPGHCGVRLLAAADGLSRCFWDCGGTAGDPAGWRWWIQYDPMHLDKETGGFTFVIVGFFEG